MRKGTLIFAAAALAAGLTACVPKTETQPSAAIEETMGTQETTGTQETQEPLAGTEDGSGIEDGAAGEGSAEISDSLLSDVYAGVKKAYGSDYIPNMRYDEAMLEGTFGVSKDQYEAYVAEGPMISAHVETFIGIKAKAGMAETVAKELETYRQSQIDGALQYPINMPKLEASQVVTYGDYVFFIMLGSVDEKAEEQGEAAALESAKKNNLIAIDTVAGFFK